MRSPTKLHLAKSSRFKNVVKIFSVILAMIVSSQSSIFAISDAQLDMFAENNILFYDPDDLGINNCYGGYASICGSSAAEKVWSGLISVGFTPEQAAGAMGNIWHESVLNPAQWEQTYDDQFDYYHNETSRLNGSGGGVGLIQWSFGRRVAILEHIKSTAPHLINLLDSESNPGKRGYASGDKLIEVFSEEDVNALFSIQIQYLYSEMVNHPEYKKVLEQDTVERAAWMFLTQVERPSGISVNTSLTQAKASRSERFNKAEEFYQQLRNFHCESSTGGMATDGSNVSIIGDSITEGSKADILSQMPNANIDSEVGRQFTVGIDIANNTILRDIVVFALGTNNTNLTKEQIDQAVITIGADKIIIFVTNYASPGSGNDYSNNNSLLNAAANDYPNVRIADWATSASADHPKLITSDGIHPTTEGQKVFANLLYNVVSSSSFSGSSCGPGGSFIGVILAYAWPEYHPSPYTNATLAYKEAVVRRRKEGKYVGGGMHPGIDCGGFVTTVVQDSGYEPKYNNAAGATGEQENWVRRNGWTNLNPSGEVDTSILQAGDVAFGDGHTFIFVGDIPGFNSNIASASYGGDNPSGSWRAPMAGRESLTGGIRWYRKGA